MKNIGRKQFLQSSALIGAAALTFGCDTNSNPVAPEIESEMPPFPYLEISESSNYDIGYKVGEKFKIQIQQIHERSLAEKIYNPESPFNGMSLTEILLSLVDSDPDKYYNPFLDAAGDHFPGYVDELKGMADGSDVEFKTVFTSVCMLEIIAALNGGQQMVNHSASIQGCSTVTYSKSGKLFFAHNEDFTTPYADLMYFVKVNQNGKPTFSGVNYPGMVLGLPPAVNSAGMVFSGNQIDMPYSSPGVPWTFLCRTLMESESIDDAISRVKLPNVAYSYHLNIGSLKEKRIVSVEVMPGRSEVNEVEGFYVHTNHFILPTMKGSSVDNENSLIRRETLLTKSEEYNNKANEVDGDLITSWMSSHDGYPNAVCVHTAQGVTLVHAQFDFQNETWKLYRGNPCNNAYKTLTLF